jgi:NADH-quinone oxidoreductase subunit N
VLKRVYVAPLPTNANKFNSPVLSQVLLLLLAVSVILFGCAPQLLLRWILQAINASGL